MEQASFCVPTYTAFHLSQLKRFVVKYFGVEHIKKRERMLIFVVAKDPSVPM